MFTSATSYDVDEHSDSEKVLLIANSEKESAFKSPQSGSGKIPKIFARHVGDKICKILSSKDKFTPICEWVSGYLQPC